MGAPFLLPGRVERFTIGEVAISATAFLFRRLRGARRAFSLELLSGWGIERRGPSGGVRAFPGPAPLSPSCLRFEVKKSGLLRGSRAAHYTLFTELPGCPSSKNLNVSCRR